MNTKVVVTGLGLVVPGAKSPDDLFSLIKNKKSTVTRNEKFEKLGIRLPIASVLSEAELDEINNAVCNGESAVRPNRVSSLALYAAEEAVKSSGISYDAQCRKGVFLGCNKIIIDLEDIGSLADQYEGNCESIDFGKMISGGSRRDYQFVSADQNQAVMLLSEKHDLHDMVFTHSDACAAGNISIGSAYRFIKNNELDAALVGGAECFTSPLGYFGFNLLGALYAGNSNHTEASQCSRPFDKERCGLVMGEGSAFLMIESEKHALERGANILCEIKGFHKTAEAVKITSSAMDGSEYIRCMQGAVEDAGLSPQDIDHINAHGTSTIVNDLCEVRAIDSYFDSNTSVTSNKSAVGHTFGASGAIEAVLSVLSLMNQELLPTLNFTSQRADEPRLDIVKDSRKCSVKNILSNSFGFCGSNSSIILGLH